MTTNVDNINKNCDAKSEEKGREAKRQNVPEDVVNSTYHPNVKTSDPMVPIYIGGGISIMILFAGIIIGFIIVQYPDCKFVIWLESFIK